MHLNHFLLKLAQLEINIVQNHIKLVQLLVNHVLMELRQIFLLVLIEVPVVPVTVALAAILTGFKVRHVLPHHGSLFALELRLEELFDLLAERLVVDLEAQGALGRLVLLLPPAQAGVVEGVPARVDHNVWHFND